MKGNIVVIKIGLIMNYVMDTLSVNEYLELMK